MSDRRHVSELFGRESGRTGLVVCGGMSGGRWREIRGELSGEWGQGKVVNGVEPVVVGMNGVNQGSGEGGRNGLDYWVGLESDEPVALWQWIEQPGTVRVMSRAIFRNSMTHRNRTDCDDVYIAERSYLGDEDDVFKMKHGLWYSNRINHAGEAPVGTSAPNVIHFAVLLGLNPVHVCGVDLCFKDEEKHHHYEDELYNDPDGRKGKSPFVRYRGVLTTRWFLESAIYLYDCYQLWRVQGLDLIDHSDGLIQMFEQDGGYREDHVSRVESGHE